MKWYTVMCDQCQWKTPTPVDERVMKKFEGMRYCEHCRRNGKPNREYTIRETITSTRKG